MKKILLLLIALFLTGGIAGADPFHERTLADSIFIGTGRDITALGGASDFDYSSSTGFIKTPSGLNYIGGNAIFEKNIKFSLNSTTTLNTTLTSSNTNTVYPVNASAASVYLVLPDAATVTGRIYVITTFADPGANNVVLTATGGDKIGTASSLTTTTPAGLTLISDGTGYGVLGSYGTWT